MKVTNFLLGLIVLLLFLHLFKNSNLSFFPEASAQTNKVKKDTIEVRIVDVRTGTFSGSLPIIYGNTRSGFVLPVDAGYEVAPNSRVTKLLPVAISTLK